MNAAESPDNFCWEARVDELREQKEAAILAHDFELAAGLRDEERKLIRKLRDAEEANDHMKVE